MVFDGWLILILVWQEHDHHGSVILNPGFSFHLHRSQRAGIAWRRVHEAKPRRATVSRGDCPPSFSSVAVSASASQLLHILLLLSVLKPYWLFAGFPGRLHSRKVPKHIEGLMCNNEFCWFHKDFCFSKSLALSKRVCVSPQSVWQTAERADDSSEL